MRYINVFSEAPKETEVIVIGKTANVYIRENVESYTVTDEDGTERTEWKAVEYFAQLVATPNFALTDALVDQVKATSYEQAAHEVREIRDRLLSESDKEILPDRLTKSSTEFKAWANYREALRDIPEQEGFPYDVVFPKKPESEV